MIAPRRPRRTLRAPESCPRRRITSYNVCYTKLLRHQGLALTGSHLGDLAVVQHHATDELHVEVAHAVHPACRFANHRKRLWQQAVERRALGKPFAELGRFGLKLLVGLV